MIPKYHIVHYKNFTVHYDNGVYRIAELPGNHFLDFTDAKGHIDNFEKGNDLEKFFDNLKKLNETN